MRLVISAGGTGGHIYPAISVIKEFMKHEANLEVLYIGTHNRMEKDIVPTYNIRYVPLKIYGFSRSPFQNLKNIWYVRKSLKECKKIISEFKPDVVMGFGGYVTYPVIKAASSLNVKTFIHEQNAIPGKSNSNLAKYATLIGVSYESSKKYFKSANKVIFTGNPCGENAISATVLDKTKLGFHKEKKLVIVVAGSQGSYTLNEKMKEFLFLVENEDYEVLYITGKAYYEDFVKDCEFPSNVVVAPFVSSLPGYMKCADLMVSRAGASTMSEILALQLPTIFIPSPYVANNHQFYNALDVVSIGAGEMLEEKEMCATVLNSRIKELLENEKRYGMIKKKMEDLKVTKSGKIIYDEVKKMLEP